MPLDKIKKVLTRELNGLEKMGSLKGVENVIVGIKRRDGKAGTRYLLEGCGDREFIRMNSNNYLGMALRKQLIEAEEEAVREFGVGPGAVRFISGTYQKHVELERRLAAFHDKESGMIFGSAYAAVAGILPALISEETAVVSDELNHNSIINAIRLSRPKLKKVYPHNDMRELSACIQESIGQACRLIIVTDGIFSMRGDHAPLREIADLAEKHDADFAEGILTVIDDSHGVGASGDTGRGTTEITGESRIDILIGTLGKAFGVNGGYLVSDHTLITYLRETAPQYIYSNPVTVGEAGAAIASLEFIDSGDGRKLLAKLEKMTGIFRNGLISMKYDTLTGVHPIVPLFTHDAANTVRLVNYLNEKGILATGIHYPVVPKGADEIRFQISAEHEESDINRVLDVLKTFKH